MSRRGDRLRLKIGVATIIMSLLLSLIPLSSYAADEGNAADNRGVDGEIEWVIEGNTLTLSVVEGSGGYMSAYQLNTSPWTKSSLASEVQYIVVANGVSTLGAYGISSVGSGNIKRLTIAGSVTYIESNQIFGLTIDEIVFQEGFKAIYEGAVMDCAVTRILFPKSIEEINMFGSVTVNG